MPSLLHQALSLDAAGNEAAAIPLYRKAIAAGLPQKHLHAALLSLASSLIAAGNDAAALRTLLKARRIFPRDPAIALHLALLHAHRGNHLLAIRQLADMLLKESKNKRLAPFRPALSQKFHALRTK